MNLYFQMCCVFEFSDVKIQEYSCKKTNTHLAFFVDIVIKKIFLSMKKLDRLYTQSHPFLIRFSNILPFLLKL